VDDRTFDDLTRSLATPTRRGLLKIAGATGIGLAARFAPGVAAAQGAAPAANKNNCNKSGSSCKKDNDCCSNTCKNGNCKCGSNGDSCNKDNDCCSGTCNNGNCKCGNDGDSCDKDKDCCDGTCKNGNCTCGKKGDSCDKDKDCCNNLACKNGNCK
jgi:hypothetical protein